MRNETWIHMASESTRSQGESAMFYGECHHPWKPFPCRRKDMRIGTWFERNVGLAMVIGVSYSAPIGLHGRRTKFNAEITVYLQMI